MSPPKQLGRYHVIGRVASGGMAEILLAKVLGPGGFERAVVIKRVLPHLVGEGEFRDMFLDEARIVAGLHHRNIVHVYELGRAEDELFLVMEYLAGESLRSLLKRAVARGVKIDFGLCAHIIAEACAGLHAAHEFTDPEGRLLQVVHRDVCPHNLFVTYDGAVKVLDFGIAQAAHRFTRTQVGQVKGKFAYMAPEQCFSRPVDRRTDIFALGVVLYELTTGHRLFSGAIEERVFAAMQRQPVEAPSHLVAGYPAELERICLRALELDAADRFATAEEMRRALIRFQRGYTGALLPEEHMRDLMHTLFDERIAEKSDLLNHLRAGEGVTHIPAPEVDDDVSVPHVATEREPMTPLDPGAGTYAVSSRRHAATSRAFRSRSYPTRTWRWVALVSAACLSVVLGFFTLQPGSDETEPASAPRKAPAATPPSSMAPVAPAPKQVTVQIRSQPAGAEVRLDGRTVGITPLSLALPTGDEPHALRLTLPGFRPLEQPLVPDVDQRLSLSLAPTRAGAAAPERKPSGRRKPRPRRESNRGHERSKPGKSTKQAKEGFFMFD